MNVNPRIFIIINSIYLISSDPSCKDINARSIQNFLILNSDFKFDYHTKVTWSIYTQENIKEIFRVKHF